MSTQWIIYGLLALTLIIVMNFIGPFKGTTQSDFPDKLRPADSNPLPPCPNSPNCVRLSVPFDKESGALISACETVLMKMKPDDLNSDLQSHKIDAVFRIPLLGFRDDFSIHVSDDGGDGTVLHLSSRSRLGKGDLGVNRRRVNKFLFELQSLN